MELIEREHFLLSLESRFEDIQLNEGHCVLLSGEAGIGKTSLIKTFCRGRKGNNKIFIGICDALFTPRPLGPFYDVFRQMTENEVEEETKTNNRSTLFTRFLQHLQSQRKPTIIVIEDIHWADEATLDFIKFFARRITQFQCLLILSYRDDEIHSAHPLRTVIGQLPPDSITRLKLPPLSRNAVENLSIARGYSGEEVYSIAGGNPFYVNEILASYSPGIPNNIRDSILSVYGRLDKDAQGVCQIMSILPTGFEIQYLQKLAPTCAAAVQTCLDLGILIVKHNSIFFKHELYRKTIETSLSPFLRLSMNKTVLGWLLESFEQKGELERIVHHAKNANANELVIKYAPQAARQAAAVGAHVEASRLYYSAIEYCSGEDKDLLISFYESYALECYLTNQIRDAIIYQERALRIWKEKRDSEKIGDCLRILSRLWSSAGNLQKAEQIGMEAVNVFEKSEPSRQKAMALSNISQIKMFLDNPDECIYWGNEAILIANALGDEETLCHALISVGSVRSRTQSSRENGNDLLEKSLELALKNNYEELVVRVYSNLVSNGIWMKDYASAKKYLEEGIQYFEKRDIGLGTYYMLSLNAWLNLDLGNWDEALRVANMYSQSEYSVPFFKWISSGIVARIKIRKGDEDALPYLLQMKDSGFVKRAPHKLLPLLTVMLEYEWLTGKKIIDNEDLEFAIQLATTKDLIHLNSEFAFWLSRARKIDLLLEDSFEGYQLNNEAARTKAVAFWRQQGCPYQQALALFEGGEDEKKKAIDIVQTLGATAVYEKMKFEMRSSGMKKIPRGMRRSTLSNLANLTDREIEILKLMKEGLQNKEIGAKLFISPKTVSHHISSILFKVDATSRARAVQEAIQLEIIK